MKIPYPIAKTLFKTYVDVNCFEFLLIQSVKVMTYYRKEERQEKQQRN